MIRLDIQQVYKVRGGINDGNIDFKILLSSYSQLPSDFIRIHAIISHDFPCHFKLSSMFPFCGEGYKVLAWLNNQMRYFYISADGALIGSPNQTPLPGLFY